MSSEENKRHLTQVLYREAFERREVQAEKRSSVTAAFPSQKYAPLTKWLHVKEQVESIICKLNKDLSAIGAAVKFSQTPPHEYSNHTYPTIGRLRLDFFQDGRLTTRHMEANLSENGIVHFYLYLPKETRRLDINVEEMDGDHIEAMLIDFVDLSTRDDFPPRSKP